MRVFLDTTVFIEWLRKQGKYYSSIETIRNLFNSNQIIGVTSLDVLLELHKGNRGAREIDLIQNKWKFEITYLTPNFIVGDCIGKYKIDLDKFVAEWKKLSGITGEDPDSKHLVTARYARCNYFLTTDNKCINKMNNNGKKFLKNIGILKPDVLLKISQAVAV